MSGLVLVVLSALVLAGPIASGRAWTLTAESGGISAVGSGKGENLPGGVGVAPGAIEPAPVNQEIEEESEATMAREKVERETAERETAEREAAQRAAADRKAAEAAALRCVVPSLKGDSLAAARNSLVRAHCKLGRVSGGHAGRGPLVVIGQMPRHGGTLPNGATVAVRLGVVGRRG